MRLSLIAISFSLCCSALATPIGLSLDRPALASSGVVIPRDTHENNVHYKRGRIFKPEEPQRPRIENAINRYLTARRALQWRDGGRPFSDPLLGSYRNLNAALVRVIESDTTNDDRPLDGYELEMYDKIREGAKLKSFDSIYNAASPADQQDILQKTKEVEKWLEFDVYKWVAVLDFVQQDDLFSNDPYSPIRLAHEALWNNLVGINQSLGLGVSVYPHAEYGGAPKQIMGAIDDIKNAARLSDDQLKSLREDVANVEAALPPSRTQPLRGVWPAPQVTPGVSGSS
ncbi:hypothetical protein FRB99_006195 [Tulasnella sp. 403]|nr:hypothetical protein FRB99_006195 [Tulasnella sp. 403]